MTYDYRTRIQTFQLLVRARIKEHEENCDEKGGTGRNNNYFFSLEEYGNFVIPNDVPPMTTVKAAIVHVE